MTAKQQKFINAYLILGNATQSAIQAGYSKKTAPFIGAENLKKPNIAKCLEIHRKEAKKRTENALDSQILYTKDLRKRCMEAGNLKAELMANDQINKIQGDYAPEKRELTVVSHAQRLKEIESMEKTGLLTDGKVIDAEFEEKSDSNS